MSRDLGKLEPRFKKQVELLIVKCQEKGVVIKPYFTLRTAQQQANLWCQGRDKDTIIEQSRRFNKVGARYLADLLVKANPRIGPVVTKALPGFSWHNYGLAVDCYVERDGKPVWDANDDGYAVYAAQANLLGLNSGYYWKSFKDAVHVQQPLQGVLATYPILEVNDMMRKQEEGK